MRVAAGAVAQHHVPRPEDDAIEVVLLAAVEVRPPDKEAVGLFVRGRALWCLRQPGFHRIVARGPVPVIPDNGVGPVRQVISGPHLDELDVADLLLRAVSATLPSLHLYP